MISAATILFPEPRQAPYPLASSPRPKPTPESSDALLPTFTYPATPPKIIMTPYTQISIAVICMGRTLPDKRGLCPESAERPTRVISLLASAQAVLIYKYGIKLAAV